MSEPARIVAYRDSMAALAALIDRIEPEVPLSQAVAFAELKEAFDRAFESADELAVASGVAAPPAEDVPEDVAAFYTHLMANLRWPEGYDRAHKLATLHSLFGRPATASEAKAQAADWYAANDTEGTDAP